MKFTRCKKEDHVMSMPSRAVYFETPEAADVVPKVEQAEASEYATAMTLDDTKYYPEESLEKGEIRKLMDSVNKSADAAIPAGLKLGAAQDVYVKLGGPDAKGKGAALKGTIAENLSLEQWKDVKKFFTFPENTPDSLVQAVKNAKSVGEARLACDQFDVDWGKSEGQMRGALEIDSYKADMISKIEEAAKMSVEQKQKSRTEAAKKDFSLSKVAALFPEDPKAVKEDLERRSQLGATYLEGLLKNVDFTPDKKRTEDAIRSAYENAGGDDKVRSFVDSLGSGTEGPFWKDGNEAEFYKNASPDVKAYMEGVLDSRLPAGANGKRTIPPEDLAVIQETFALIPEDQRDSLSAVKAAFELIRPKIRFEKEVSQYTSAKVLELYPDDPNDPKLEEKRSCAKLYLDGVFRSVTFHYDMDSLKHELDTYFTQYPPSSVRDYVSGIVDQNKYPWSRSGDPKFTEMFKDTPRDVHVFLEGVIMSFVFEHDDGKIDIDAEQADWVLKTYNAIPESERGNINAVRSAFSKCKARNVYSMDDSKQENMDAARLVLAKNNPEINSFFERRMAIAEDTFWGTGSFGRYRTMILHAIAQQNPDQPDMAKLEALPMPINYESGTQQVQELPADAALVSQLPKTLETYAKRLTSRMEQAGAVKPFVVKIEYDGGNYYYAKNPPFQIYSVPENKPV